MTERLDALTVRESNGKSYFTKIGVAFPAKSGNGYSVLLDAVPASVDGQYKILLTEPKERTNDTPRQQPARQAEYDEDRPF
jgi:hypothetical protein